MIFKRLEKHKKWQKMAKKVKNEMNYSKCSFLCFKQKSIENWGKLEGVKVLFLPRNEIHYS